MATTTGTTGVTPPTHTSGSASDGAVTWQYIATSNYNLEPSHNDIGPNIYKGNLVGNYQIDSTGINFFHDSDRTQFGRQVSAWAATTAYVVGNMVYSTGGTGTKRLYRCVVAGTTGSTTPTVTSGTQTDGTVTWLFVATANTFQQLATQNDGMRLAGVTELASLESATNIAKFAAISTNPEAFLVAEAGSLVLQRGANTFDHFPWWKDSGTGNTGWQRILKQISNNTANRPGYNASTYTGLPYYNTETEHWEVYAGTALGWLPFDSLGTQAVTAAGALNILRRTNTLSNATGATYAVTLAAPGAAQLGQRKIISMIVGDGTNTVTLALTNVVGGSAATTATFDVTGETLVLEAIQTGASTYRWLVIKEHGVTLS